VNESDFTDSETEYLSRQARLIAARAAVEVAEAKWRAASADAVAQRTNAELRIDERLRLERAEVDLAEAALRLERHVVRASIDGVVLRRLVEPGSRLMLDGDHALGSAVAVLYDPARLQVRVDVPLADAPKIGAGQPAEIAVEASPGKIFRGVLTRWVGEADIEKNTIQAKVSLRDPDSSIRPEMLARVRFLALASANGGAAPAKGATALFAPAGAIAEGVAWVAMERDGATCVVRQRQVAPHRRGGRRMAGSGLRPAAGRSSRGRRRGRPARRRSRSYARSGEVAMAFIECRSLSRVYHRGENVIRPLDALDLDVEQGEFLALMGPSGSGKTTLLNLIAGIDRPTSGSLRIGGVDVGKLSRSALAPWRAANVGYVFQLYNLVPVLTAYENVELPLLLRKMSRAERHKRVKTALGLTGVADRHDHYPRQLSGGQEQRVAIARAIVAQPRLVVADEPTGDLDKSSAEEVLGLLSRLASELGGTLVMVTHDPRAAERAGRVLHLEKGRLAERAGEGDAA
jgi:putative ABC transport system ATP-binding protein